VSGYVKKPEFERIWLFVRNDILVIFTCNVINKLLFPALYRRVNRLFTGNGVDEKIQASLFNLFSGKRYFGERNDRTIIRSADKRNVNRIALCLYLNVFFSYLYLTLKKCFTRRGLLTQKIKAMKQFFTLLLLFSCFSAFSQEDARQKQGAYNNASIISITGYRNQDYTVFLDGKAYEPNQNNEVYISGVRPGRHVFRIVGQGGIFASHTSRQLYNATINTRNQYQVDFMINRNGKVFKDEFVIKANNNNNYNPVPGGFGRPNYMTSMRAGDFTNLKRTAQSQRFESEKLMVVKQALSVNYFTVSQVKELMQLFTYDESKLEIAKLAYERTVDRENYYRVNEELTYSSSKEELNKFLMNYRN